MRVLVFSVRSFNEFPYISNGEAINTRDKLRARLSHRGCSIMIGVSVNEYTRASSLAARKDVLIGNRSSRDDRRDWI